MRLSRTMIKSHNSNNELIQYMKVLTNPTKSTTKSKITNKL